MSNTLISFLFALGFSGWVYAKAYRSTGGNTRNSLIMAAGVAVAAFAIMFIILGMVFPNS
jgi:hypothetical protein